MESRAKRKARERRQRFVAELTDAAREACAQRRAHPDSMAHQASEETAYRKLSKGLRLLGVRG